MPLPNLLGIDDDDKLAREEERICKIQALEIFENNVLDSLEPGTFERLAEIHRCLFEGIYPFAGEIRHENLARGCFVFAPVMFLDATLEMIERMPQNTFDQIIEKYVEMNVAHPFREGNGRSARIWLDHILKNQLGQVVDWSEVNKNEYLQAMARSPVSDAELKALLKAALTDQVNDRDVFIRGIGASFSFESFSVYLTDELCGNDR